MLIRAMALSLGEKEGGKKGKRERTIEGERQGQEGRRIFEFSLSF
jgi:hypothetical protein